MPGEPATDGKTFMERTSASRLPINDATTPDHLKDFLRRSDPEARLRIKKGELFCRTERKGSSVAHAGAFLTGQTRSKREGLMAAVARVFGNRNIDLEAHINTVLLPHEVARLKGASGDLKVKHLMRVFTGTVKNDGELYTYDRLTPFAKGSYGQIFKATDDSGRSQIALKESMAPVAEDDELLKRETAMHLCAWKAAGDGVNYVVETGELVMGYDGRIFQPMGLAVCSGEKLLNKLAHPSHEFDTDVLTLLTAHDWLMSLCQIQSVGMAHRDIKPENWLLSKEGVWQLSDFGTAGDASASFMALGTKKGSHKVTGNGSVFSKAPEWLRSEMPWEKDLYRVGPEADVFALGVAVFRLISGGSLPFDDPAAPSNTEIDYEGHVLDFASSGLSYCTWYARAYGREIPQAWQDFLNAALHADPAQRAQAHQLLALPAFQLLQSVDVPQLREQLLRMAASGVDPG